jgi:hypothetical protein
VSTTLTPKDPADEAAADTAASDGPGNSVRAPERRGLGHWRELLRFGFVVVVVVGAFIALGWGVEWFREVLALLAPHVSMLLWGAVAALLGISLVRQVFGIGWRAPEGVQRIAFLSAPCAFAGSIIAYLVQLFASWENGGASWFTIGGVVPWSDANSYFGGAQRLLFDGQLDAFNSRRPLHAAFLASELALTNLDLRKVLVIQAVLLGVASYLAARAVAEDLGPLTGLALFAGIYGFARVGVDTVSTETMGVALGALAFAALWQAIRRSNVWLVAGGLFLLAFAFDFRPGPILLLLTLPVAFACLLRGSRRINWRVLGLSIAVVMVAIAANYIAIFTFHGDSDNLNANANYTIYGMAKGLPGWSSEPVSWYQLYADHPEIIEMSETDRNRFVSARAREELTSHPGAFARSYVEGASNYFRAAADYVIAPVPNGLSRVVVCATALVLAVVVFIARWRTSSWRVLLDAALFGGIVLALPAVTGAWPYGDDTLWGWNAVGAGSYLPWWFGAAVGTVGYVAFILIGSERLRIGRHLWLVSVTLATVTLMMPLLGNDTMRFFAAAIPFMVLSLAFAVAVVERVSVRRDAIVTAPAMPRRDTPGQLWAPVLVGGAVAAIAVIGAPIAAAVVDRPATPPKSCPDGRQAEPLIGGAGVTLVENSRGAEGDLDELEVSRVTSSPAIRSLQDRGVFGPILARTTIIKGLTRRGHDRIAFVDGALSAPRRSVLYLCGSTISDRATNALLKEWPLPLDVFAGTTIDVVQPRH